MGFMIASARRLASIPVATTSPSLNDVLTYDGTQWAPAAGGGGSGANAALSNLASVSINASLIPQATLNLGAQSTPWKEVWLYGSGTFGSHSLKLTGTPTGHRVVTFPDASITVAGSASALTSGRVAYATTGGLLTDSAGLTFSDAANVRLLTVRAGSSQSTSNLQEWQDNSGVAQAYLVFDSGNTQATLGVDTVVSPVSIWRLGQAQTGLGFPSTWSISWSSLSGYSGADTALTRASANNIGITNASSTTYATIGAGGFVLSVNGALSAPAITGTGTWITGGTETSTKPYVLIEPTGTTSTGWSTSGTGVGVNAASGFGGNLIDIQLNGASRLKLTAGGQATFESNVFSTAGGFLAAATGSFAWSTTRSVMQSPANSIILLANAAVDNFDRLQFGGTTNLFPAFKRSTTGLIARLADDSADTWLQASQFRMTLTTPASAGATGVQGSHVWDDSYLYVCTATNTWKRVAIATW